MIFAASVFLLVVFYINWLWSKYNNLWKHLAKFPGPKTVPIFGNILQIGFTQEDHLRSLRRWTIEFEFQPFRVYAGPMSYIFVADSKTVETILSSTTLTYKDDVYSFMRPWLGNGLLTSNNKHWQTHRKMITPSFHFQILQDFLHIINETTDRFTKFLNAYAVTGKMFDFQEIVAKSTVDAICESAMGTCINTIENENSTIATAVNELSRIVAERIFGFLKRSDLLFRLFPDNRLQAKNLAIMRHELFKIIEERRLILNEQTLPQSAEHERKHHKMAFLDNLLTAKIDGQPLTFQDIFEEVSTFMFEGHDTTASAITFAIFCLSRHPHVQQKAFEEQYELFGSDTQNSPTYQQLQQMKYLELVIKETLRLFPSVPLIARTVQQPTEINGLVVPKGVTLAISIFAMCANEQNFKQPFAFQPERFADEQKTLNPFDSVPFSAGPRNCIGQKFALMELKVTISKILRNFCILPAIDGLPTGLPASIHHHIKPSAKSNNPYDPLLAAHMTLKSVNGVLIRLKKRVY